MAKPGPKSTRVPKHSRLLSAQEIQRALDDRVLEPLRAISFEEAANQLRKKVEDEGGTCALARKLNICPSALSEALSGRRHGFGKVVSAWMGLEPKIAKVAVFEVVNPRKFYRRTPSLL